MAIKLLAASTTWSPEARARFEREAQVISRLNHPHTCALFDVSVWRFISADLEGVWVVRDGYGVEVARERAMKSLRGSVWKYTSCTATAARSLVLESNFEDGLMLPGVEIVDGYRLEGDVIVWQHSRPDGTLTPEARSERVR